MYLLPNVFSVIKSAKAEMGGRCTGKMLTKFCLKKIHGKKALRRLDVHGKTILKCIVDRL